MSLQLHEKDILYSDLLDMAFDPNTSDKYASYLQKFIKKIAQRAVEPDWGIEDLTFVLNYESGKIKIMDRVICINNNPISSTILNNLKEGCIYTVTKSFYDDSGKPGYELKEFGELIGFAIWRFIPLSDIDETEKVTLYNRKYQKPRYQSKTKTKNHVNTKNNSSSKK